MDALSATAGGKLLAIYLNDHFAGSTFGVEVVRRARDQNAGTELGEFLERLAVDIRQDRQALERIMRMLDVRRDGAKVAAGWLAEKARRAKPNGRLGRYSPLGRVLDLETLSGGVQAKLALWRALLELAPGDPRLDASDLGALASRAERQLEELRRQHAVAARDALTER